MSSRREKAIVYSLGALQKIFRFFCVLSWRSLLWRTVCERTLDCVFDRGGCNNRAIVNAWLGLDGGLLSGFISQSLFPPLSFSRAHILCQRVVVSVCVWDSMRWGVQVCQRDWILLNVFLRWVSRCGLMEMMDDLGFAWVCHWQRVCVFRERRHLLCFLSCAHVDWTVLILSFRLSLWCLVTVIRCFPHSLFDFCFVCVWWWGVHYYNLF